MGKTKDKKVYKTLGLCGFASGSNGAAVEVKDGRIARIYPMRVDDEYSEEYLRPWTIEARGKKMTSGFKSSLSPHNIAYKQRVYSKNRVPFPLKRVDFDPHGERNVQNRGKSDYVRISWDEAAQICADEIQRICDEYGPTAVYCQASGHGECKAIGGGHGCNTHLMTLLGGFTLQARQPDSWEGWYWGAKHMWGMDPIGQQLYQSNLLQDICDNTDCTLLWGADPETTPWGWGGQIASKICYFWGSLGIKQIYICPDLNYAAAVHADKWIPVLPNTDAALQLAIAYVWMDEGLYDKDYVETHTDGFDWFEYYVTGREDGVPKTPKWAEEKCGVPSRIIKALARYWAKHTVTTCHCNGGGYIRSVFAHEPARLEIALLAMQGVGGPGRNMFKFTEGGQFGIAESNPFPKPEWGTFMAGAYTGHVTGTGLENMIPQTLLPDAIFLPEGEKLTWPGRCVCTMPRFDQYTDYQYPAEGASRIHMIWTDTPCWSTCWNGGNRLQDALRSEEIEFYLVQHPWMENDTLFGDIILPVSTKFEQHDIMTCDYDGVNNMVLDECQAVEPVGEARSDSECVLAIAEKMGLGDALMEKWCYPAEVFSDNHKTDGESADGSVVAYKQDQEHVFGEPSFEMLHKAGFERGGCNKYLTYEEFCEKGYLAIPFKENWQDDPIGMQDFYYDPENHPLDTPTGKIEFYSTQIAARWPGDEQRPPVPHWIEESDEHHERLTNERGKTYPFLMVSNHPRFRLHAELDDVAWLREIGMCKVVGPDGYAYEPVWINPLDAAEKGIADGDVVRVFNERGSVLGGALLTERIMRHCISQDHGARVDSIVRGTGGLDRGGANNLICPGATTSKNAPGEVTNGFLVDFEKVDVAELAAEYPEKFNRIDYDAADGFHAWDRIVKED